jgi:hypothetical protein
MYQQLGDREPTARPVDCRSAAPRNWRASGTYERLSDGVANIVAGLARRGYPEPKRQSNRAAQSATKG